MKSTLALLASGGHQPRSPSLWTMRVLGVLAAYSLPSYSVIPFPIYPPLHNNANARSRLLFNLNNDIFQLLIVFVRLSGLASRSLPSLFLPIKKSD
ncbi:hypothetical protein LguiB_013719 [Lonicera macranthoides]